MFCDIGVVLFVEHDFYLQPPEQTEGISSALMIHSALIVPHYPVSFLRIDVPDAGCF